MTLDLSEACFVDCSGLACLIAARRRLQRGNGELLLCGLTPRLSALLATSGLHRLFRTDTT